MSGVLLKCLRCTKTFTKQKALNLHVKVHHSFEGEVYEEMLQGGLDGNTGQNGHEQLFHLDYLTEWQAIQSTGTLYIHSPGVSESNSHASEKNADEPESSLGIQSCPICQAHFTSEDELSSHTRMAHQQILAYQCSLCKTKLKTTQGVESHFRFIHGKEFETKGLMMDNVTVSYVGNGPRGDENIPKNNDRSRKGNKSFNNKALSPKMCKRTHGGCKKRNKCKSTWRRQQLSKTDIRKFRCRWPGCKNKFTNRIGRFQHYKTHFKSPKSNGAIEHQEQIIDDNQVQDDAQQETSSLETNVVTSEAEKGDVQQLEQVGESSDELPTNPESSDPSHPSHASISTRSTNLCSVPNIQPCSFRRDSTGIVFLSRDPSDQTTHEVGNQSHSQNYLTPVSETVAESEAPILSGLLRSQNKRTVMKSSIPGGLMKSSSVCNNWLWNGGSVTLTPNDVRKPVAGAALNTQFGAPVEQGQTYYDSQEPPLITLDSDGESEVVQPSQTIIWNCFICPASFSAASQLNEHMNAQHGQQPVPEYSCHACGKGYATINQLKYHLHLVHDKVLKTRDIEQQEPFQANECVWKYLCPYLGCEAHFSSKEELGIHLETHGLRNNQINVGDGNHEMVELGTMNTNRFSEELGLNETTGNNFQSPGTVQGLTQQQSSETSIEPVAHFSGAIPTVPVPVPSSAYQLQCGTKVYQVL